MIAVGERINGMFKDVKKAIRNKDKAVLQDLAVRQTKEGAKYLDINTGVAVTLLQAGADIIRMRHPKAIAATRRVIDDLIS